MAKLGCNPLLAAAKKVTIWRFYCIEDSCQLGPSVVAWLALPSSTTSFTCLQSKEIQQGAQAKGSVGFLTSPLMALHSSTSPRTALQSKPNVETRCRHTPEHQSNKPTLEYLCNKITCLLRSRENVVFRDIKCRLIYFSKICNFSTSYGSIKIGHSIHILSIKLTLRFIWLAIKDVVQLVTFNLNLNAQHINGMTPFD